MLKTRFSFIIGTLLFLSFNSYASIRDHVWQDDSTEFHFLFQDTRVNYYDQFLFTVLGDCKQIDKLWFRSLFSWESAQLGKDEQGRPEVSNLHLQLFSNHTYWAEYDELAIVKHTEVDGVIRTEYERLFEKKGITGKWGVKDNKIEMDQLGFGVPSQYTDVDDKIRNSIKFQFTSKINDVRILNTTMDIARSITNVGPNGISINEYCGVHP